MTSTLPGNILQVDIFALEFSILLRAQQRGLPGTPSRQTPLSSLGALLQTLQIPVPQFAPLGNAGNEAFYTVLAFQKLMMSETRLPDMLFQTDGYPYPAYPYVPQPYPAHGPPSLAPRRQSSSTMLRPDARQAIPPSPSRHPHRRASEYTRPRPSSMADPTPRDALNGSRQGNFATSQTVFWDDADFAAEPGLMPGQASSGNSEDSARGKRPPTSWRVTGGSSRSISWENPSLETGVQTPQRTHVSSNASSPHRSAAPGIGTSASSLRLADKRITVAEPWEEAGADPDQAGGTKDKLKAKASKPKLKSDKSVKDLAGALARFWVG